jgi:peptidoglycan hydrolase CwlO-like protein
MSDIEKKEKNLNLLVDKLNSLSLSYSQPNYEIEKIKTEKNHLSRQKNEIEKKNQELMREHKYLKEKIKNLQLEVNKRLKIEDKFNEDVEELSKETENLLNDIDKWQM